ncbi:MAG: hypothetical protein M3Q27_17030 [Actinomycetota bacterium]|nr:hypothetical protein [Actinomycetota bacterium]
MTVRFCSVCASTRVFEPVPCTDGHGSDCPEVLCVECGYVVVVGVVAEVAAVPETTRFVA